MKTAINLLWLEARPAPLIIRRQIWRGLGLLLLIGGLATGGWMAYSWQVSYRAELAAVRAEAETLQAAVSAWDELAGLEAELEAKQDFLDQTRETRPLSRAMQVLTEVVPTGLIVSSFAVDGADTLALEGTAPSLGSVARLMRALEASGYYQSPLVVFPQPFSNAGGKLEIPFKITARLGSGAR